KKVLDSLQISYTEEPALAVRVTDRPGALGRATRKLASAGININYAYGSILKGQDQALIVLGLPAAHLENAAEMILYRQEFLSDLKPPSHISRLSSPFGTLTNPRVDRQRRAPEKANGLD